MEDVLKYISKSFDAFGIAAEGGKTFLILGLVSGKRRNLDAVVLNGRQALFVGMRSFFTPKTVALIKMLKRKEFEVEQAFYSALDMKELAVKAGIGSWGKNSLVIHPKFGPWLRFVVLETDAPFEPTVSGLPIDLCGGCELCIKACPVEGLLKFYSLTDGNRCLANINTGSSVFGLVSRCDKCLTSCPIGPG